MEQEARFSIYELKDNFFRTRNGDLAAIGTRKMAESTQREIISKLSALEKLCDMLAMVDGRSYSRLSIPGREFLASYSGYDVDDSEEEDYLYVTYYFKPHILQEFPSRAFGMMLIVNRDYIKDISECKDVLALLKHLEELEEEKACMHSLYTSERKGIIFILREFKDEVEAYLNK